MSLALRNITKKWWHFGWLTTSQKRAPPGFSPIINARLVGGARRHRDSQGSRSNRPLALNELQLQRRENDHLEKQPPVSPALDIGFAVNAFFVPNRHIRDFQI
jgi:hypothetical protein